MATAKDRYESALRGTRKFSLVRALTAAAHGALDGLEREVSDETARITGRPTQPHSVHIPTSMLVRDLAVSNTGGYLVATQQTGPLPFIELIRARSVVGTLGATVLDGLRGNLMIPKGSTASTAQWLSGEADAITPSTPTITALHLQPRTVGAVVKFSALLAKQSSPAVESLLYADLAASLAEAVDVAAVQGSGVSGVPHGIIGTTGVGSVTGTSLGWAGLVDAQFDVVGAYGVVPGGLRRCHHRSRRANAHGPTALHEHRFAAVGRGFRRRQDCGLSGHSLVGGSHR